MSAMQNDRNDDLRDDLDELDEEPRDDGDLEDDEEDAEGAGATKVSVTRLLRFSGAVGELSRSERQALFERATSGDEAVRDQVASILEFVKERGDEALRGLARELDGVKLDALEVPRAEWLKALEATPAPLRRAMERAIANIVRAHGAFRPQATEVETEPGVVVGRRPDPLDRVGIYAPGGRAAYPSSLLMGAIPARVAGVGEVIVCSPPQKDGRPAPVVLAAAALAGVDRVFALGGAGAIAALAYGTKSVPRVDRIVGPGNAWVAEAKVQVSNVVGIDAPAGPSELLVIADGSAGAADVARELLAQAEHDPRACVVAVCVGAETARKVRSALVHLLAEAPKRDVVGEALATGGGVLEAKSLDEAIAFANEYAPEHLQLVVADTDAALAKVKRAGTVFLGSASSVAFGDYMTGANHVLPTGGLARSWSGLSTLDFVRWTTWQRVSPAAAARLAGDVGLFADAEELPGHAAAARAWADESPAPGDDE